MSEVPKEAVEAAKKQWRLVAELPQYEPEVGARGVSDDYRERVAEHNNRAISQVLSAAAPAIREQVMDELLSESAIIAAENRLDERSEPRVKRLDIRYAIQAAISSLRDDA